MKRLLIVSPHFPPVNTPDMQRVRMSLPHFVEAGWEVVVLTVDDREPQAPLEPELLETIPAEVRVVRASCFSRAWTRWLGVNNLGWRAWLFLFTAGWRLLRQERFTAVYFSTTQFIVLPLGRVWRRLCGVPFVVDLQDPWVSDRYRAVGASTPPGGWKFRIAQAHARLLEGWTMCRAAHVISVSARYLDELDRRYPWFRETPRSVLTFGAPERDLALARQRAAQKTPLLPSGVSLKIAYAGRLGPDMRPALKLLFTALSSIHTTRQIEIFFHGTSYAPAHLATRTTDSLAAECGVQSSVRESPARIGYIDSLRLLLESDLGLLLGSTDTAYSPSKIYPTLLAEKPTIAIVPEGSVLQQALGELGGAAIISFSPTDPNPAAALAQLRGLLTSFAADTTAALGPPLDRARFAARCSSAAIANAQLEIFERLASA